MPVTVKVNGTVNSLVHKGSNGISMATIPDVCKTPSPGGPVPIPYPNISQSATLAKGTTTVKADGMMIAIKGSEFSLSNGDNAGVAGGVKSSTFMKESTWFLYSFDVKMDGQNAARLTDKKFQNHENTADLAGYVGPAVPMTPAEQAALDEECAKRRAAILRKYSALGKELRKYDPASDALGGFKKHGGLPGLTRPCGHYMKNRDLQRGLKNDLFDFTENCAKKGSTVKIDTRVDRMANAEIGVPPGCARIPL